MRQRIVILSMLILLTPLLGAAPASQSSEDAWPLYAKAIARVQEGYRAGINSPAASSLMYPDYPPYPPEWKKLEDASFEFNAPARALAHEARLRNKADWPNPPPREGKPDYSYLNGCRALANEIADAVIQEHLHGDETAAVESVRDLLHLSDLLDDGNPPPSVIRALVALGVQMIGVVRLEVITSDVALTKDPADSKRLQVNTAKELIRQLFDGTDPAQRFADLLRREAGQINAAQKDRFLTQMRRGQMERNLACMSLACHLFRFDKGSWPASLEELTTYLPAPPRDAWGAMGYAVVKLPDGADRPLVYSHCNSKDGLFYPTNEPQFSYDPGLGSGDNRKQGGQFRDVSLWHPSRPNPPPTTQPLR